MTTPIKNDQAPPPQTDPYGGGGYGDGYDPNMDNGDPWNSGYDPNAPQGSQYVPGDPNAPQGAPAPGGGNYTVTVDDLRSMLNQMKSEGKITAAEYATFQGRINHAVAMSGDSQQTEFSKIAMDLDAIANPAVDPSAPPDGTPPPVNVDDIKKQANTLKTKIEGAENLTEDEKVELGSQVDTILNQIELAGKDPDKLAALDIEGMKTQLTEIDGNVDKDNQFSPAVKGLAAAAGGDMTPEQIAAKAEAAGIDLNNLQAPPSQEVLDFLKDIIPDLKDKLTAVETAVSDRTKYAADELRAANTQNDSNDTGDTSNADNMDMTHWQNLLDLKFHQDPKSKAVTDAMQAVVNELTPVLAALYPGQDVKAVETSGVSGWQKTNGDFQNADKVSIGGTTIDLFGAADGKLHSSTTSDEGTDPNVGDAGIEIPTIKYDASGDGSWKPAKSMFNLYGDTNISTKATDEAEDYPDDGKLRDA